MAKQLVAWLKWCLTARFTPTSGSSGCEGPASRPRSTAEPATLGAKGARLEKEGLNLLKC